MTGHTERQVEMVRCCGPEGCGEPDSNNNDRYCIGAGCMAWRWTEAMFDGPDSYQAEPGPTGYCGLAGKPIGVP